MTKKKVLTRFKSEGETDENDNVEVVKALESIQKKVSESENLSKDAIEKVAKDLADFTKANEATLKDNKDLTAKVEKLEGVIKALPDNGEAEVAKSEVLAIVEAGGMIQKASVEVLFTKAYTANENVAGGSTGVLPVYGTQSAANPFRSLGTVFPTMGTSFLLPVASGIAFAREGSQPADGRNAGGSLASTEVQLRTWTSENAYSLSSLQDVPGLDGVVVSLIMQEAAKTEAQDAVAALKAGAFTSINTGVAANLPADNKIVAKLADLVTSLDEAYLANARFVLSRAVYGKLHKADNNGLAFDPANGITTLFGFPITISGYVEAGTSANHKSAYFGDFAKGLVIASSEGVSVSRFDQTKPGSLTYYSQFRGKATAWDTSALVALKTAV